MSEADVGRIPVQFIQVDGQECSLTYGTAPCTAELGVTGTKKCFNTRRTCQDPDNYDPQDKTYTFTKPQTGFPYEDFLCWPFLEDVNDTPTKINPAGGNKDLKALGSRAQVTITLSDAPDSDIGLDKYLADRAYEPMEQGTFWGKFKARNPYYQNWPVRVYDGYEGQDIGDMQVRHYVMDQIKGPANGRVSIVAKDVLALADTDKAQFPPALNSELDSYISDSDTTITVNLSAESSNEWRRGILPKSYPQFNGLLRVDGEPTPFNFTYEGYVIIGDEVIRFTDTPIPFNATSVNLLNCERGSLGTSADSHDATDEVQPFGWFENRACYEVAWLMLRIWGRINPAFFPYESEWVPEGETWLAPFNVTGYVGTPMGVDKLVGELCRECMFFIWWDERAQFVKMKALRPPTEEVQTLTFEDDILSGSTAVTESPNERISRLFIYYLPRDKSEKITEEKNFAKLRAEIDFDAESSEQYGQQKIETIYSRWLQSDAQALNVSVRYLSRYRDNPRYFMCTLDAENRDIWIGDVVKVEHFNIQDDEGGYISTLFQVISAQEIESGTRIKYELQDYEYTSRFGFWMEEDAPDYVDATDEEKTSGMWWADDNGKLPDGSDGYNWS